MDRITGKTGLTGLLGRPVSHSISPLMHNAAFEACGLDYVYLCFDAGEEELESAVNGLKALGARGWNCTMPDKKKMARLCDHLSLAAAATGSVNTVVNEGGVLTGYNTDGIGYMMSLKDAGFDVTGGKMTLLGAGGAALSILAQAAIDGLAEITVFNRRSKSFEDAVAVADYLKTKTDCRIRVCDINDRELLKETIQSSDILVNATNVGMAPDLEGCLIPDASWLPRRMIVSDIIYNPRETKLLKLAKEAGCPFFNGMYMLLYQGAEAYRLWTGVEMPVAMIKQRYFTG
ncbi:MAG: shikimate dehydrogenase [Lachnospiraceae bacterium]|nr:shikimate dehydrogenase [Lachnospiraceae bacterium]